MVDLSPAAFVHPCALLYGDIAIGKGVSIWPYAVARAEVYGISIGDYTNIQDHVMLHVGYGTGLKIGAYCSVTHRAVLHGCTIGDNCLIGIGATVMDGAVIGENSIVGEQALVRSGFIALIRFVFRLSCVRIIRAGTPATIEFGGAINPDRTSACSPTIEFSPITAPSMGRPAASRDAIIMRPSLAHRSPLCFTRILNSAGR